jgi:peptidoglycan/xylan/chitin deacetylase (PgdA/CDA1 family)
MATFFVVGSRVIERPDVLIEEYMAGHEISVHTWSHHVRLDGPHFAMIN